MTWWRCKMVSGGRGGGVGFAFAVIITNLFFLLNLRVFPQAKSMSIRAVVKINNEFSQRAYVQYVYVHVRVLVLLRRGHHARTHACTCSLTPFRLRFRHFVVVVAAKALAREEIWQAAGGHACSTHARANRPHTRTHARAHARTHAHTHARTHAHTHPC